jgi:ribulose-5-phosphate 4-epimerase/fuculose-1-phosphate aldolase
MNLADLAHLDPETRARHELAALYRLIAHFRMTDLVDTHISARVPGQGEHFLINRYGVLFHEMRPEDLVKIDPAGDPVEQVPEGFMINKAGFTIHSAIHMARHDLECVVHTHTADGIAVACQEDGLLPITQHALKFYNRLGYHDYQGVALDLEERESLVKDLGTHNAMILRNHGLLAGGRSIAEAFLNIYFLERACQAQIKALAGGRKLTYPSEAVCERAGAQFDGNAQMHAGYAWASALRLID